MPAVPQELMDRLERANERFSQARAMLERMIETNAAQDGSAGTALRAAERELDDVRSEIDKCLASGDLKTNPDVPPTEHASAE
jgi:hypothetical protein